MSVDQMQRIDAAAIDTLGIPRLLLMEHAGLAVARAARSMVSRPGGSMLICCGAGFNGGDGLAAARHLHDWGFPLRLVLTCRCSDLRGEPAVYATILQRLGLSVTAWVEGASEVRHQLERWLAEAELVIDALLGLGLRGAVREPTAALIALMNRADKPILAVDLPSGLDGDTGAVHGIAVRATTTVTFGLAKRGCVVGEGPAHTGTLIVDPITVPRHLLEQGAG